MLPMLPVRVDDIPRLPDILAGHGIQCVRETDPFYVDRHVLLCTIGKARAHITLPKTITDEDTFLNGRFCIAMMTVDRPRLNPFSSHVRLVNQIIGILYDLLTDDERAEIEQSRKRPA